MKKTVLLAAGAVVLFQAFSAAFSAAAAGVGVDESWNAELSFFQQRDGYPHSELFRGYCRSEERVVLMARLFVLAGAAVTRIAGFHLLQLRLMILIMSAAIAWLVWRYARGTLRLGAAPAAASVAVLLLFPVYLRLSATFRPEVMYTLTGFGSFLLLQGRGGRKLLALPAGILAGLSVTTHLNGSAFALAGLAVLVWERRSRALPLFAAGLVLALTPWLLEILAHMPLFREQVSGEIVAGKTSFGPLTPVLNLVEEHKRLFRKPETILPSLLIVSSILCSSGSSLHRHRFLYRYLALLAAALGMIASCKTVTYTVPLLPFGACCFGVSVHDMLEGWRPVRLGLLRRGFLVLMTTAVTGQGLLAGGSALASVSPDPGSAGELAGSLIPEGEECLAPMHLVFGQVHRLRIRSLYLARVLRGGGEMDMDYLLEYADRQSIRFIVLDGYWKEHITDWPEFLRSGTPGVVATDAGGLTVLEAVSPGR